MPVANVTTPGQVNCPRPSWMPTRSRPRPLVLGTDTTVIQGVAALDIATVGHRDERPRPPVRVTDARAF